MIGAIPVYGLYGEDRADPAARFVHVETIASRSAMLDWEIAPHRHERYFQLLVLVEGAAEIMLDDARETLRGPAYVAILPGVVHGYRFDSGVEGFVLTCSPGFMLGERAADDPVRGLLARGGSGPLDAVEARRATRLGRELLDLADDWEPGDALFFNLAEAVIRSVLRAASFGGGAAPDARVERFRALVEAHFLEHRDIAFYADRLGLTRRTLARLTAAHLGMSPIDVVHRRLAVETTRLLHYTDMTVVAISDRLGFSDPSYLSRFYQRMTGLRPSEERARQAPG